jgi:protein arginine N-methyltransferase 2
MKEQGWYDKKGVSILEGKWQDCIASGALQGFGRFDVIYTDTFSENYSGELFTQITRKWDTVLMISR